MLAAIPETVSEPLDRLDRAAIGVDRAVGRLILLIGDEDEAVARGAMLALHGLGPVAFLGPLADSFLKPSLIRMKGWMFAMILQHDTIGRPGVLEVLQVAQAKIDNPGHQPLVQIAIDTLTLRQFSSWQSEGTAGPTDNPAAS